MSSNVKLILATALAAVMSTASLLTRLSWNNLDLITLDSLVRPFISVSVLTIVLAVPFYFFSKRTFALVPAVVFLLFTYGPMSDLFAAHAYNRALTVAILITLISIVLYLTRNTEPLKVANGVCALLFILTAPMAVPLIGLAFQAAPPQIGPQFADYVDSLGEVPAAERSNLPDVIYIIPDRYASAGTLQTDYGLDNADFYQQLQSRGFQFNANATANYPKTSHSVASTTNSGYLNEFAERYGQDTGRMQPVTSTFENSLAQKAMRRLGYRFINAGSWWDASRINGNADENYGMDITKNLDKAALSEAEFGLWRGTPLREFVGFLGNTAGISECHRIKRKLEWLASVGNQAEPVFVLAHMTIPHTPIVADRDGNCLDYIVSYPALGITWPRFKAAYAEYLQYFNKAILSAFDRQTASRAASGRKLMFIIQSDEGPYPETTRLQTSKQNFIDLPEPEMRTKLGILNAMHLGAGISVPPEQLRTPINNWRIILEQITGKPAGREDHKVYIYKDYQSVHDYIDVTDKYLK